MQTSTEKHTISSIKSAKSLKQYDIPIYRTPEQRVRTLFELYEYGQILKGKIF